ncbi:hypothetical protein [Nocardia callitridis]|uniref:hypothetical protein n=1 Tax=Nocardia callitridis TaxID=648753 RepID=UPI0031E752BD
MPQRAPAGSNRYALLPAPCWSRAAKIWAKMARVSMSTPVVWGDARAVAKASAA